MRRGLLAIVVLASSWIGISAASAQEQAGEQQEIPDCRNVSSDTRVERYNTRNYLTTWGSAFVEGAGEGFSEGLPTDNRLADAVRQRVLNPTRDNSESIFYNLGSRVKPFCRAYTANFERVSSVIAQIMPLLGNPVTVSDEDAGIFQTDFITRSHIAATWKDKYLIEALRSVEGRVIVRVFREVYISRTPNVYNRAYSSGQNEKWIFTQIGDRIAVQ